MKEQEQYMSLLQQLKDYDERLTEELAAKAFQEQEKQKLEVMPLSCFVFFRFPHCLTNYEMLIRDNSRGEVYQYRVTATSFLPSVLRVTDGSRSQNLKVI